MSNKNIYKEINMMLGEKLKQLRINKKLTQSQLGNIIGLSQSAIYKYEKGERQVPMIVLVKLADVLDTTIDELFNDTQNYNEPAYIREIKSYNLTESEIEDIMKYVRYITSDFKR